MDIRRLRAVAGDGDEWMPFSVYADGNQAQVSSFDVVMVSSSSPTLVKDRAFYIQDTISENAVDVYGKAISAYLPNVVHLGEYAFQKRTFEDADIKAESCVVGAFAFGGARFAPFYDKAYSALSDIGERSDFEQILADAAEAVGAVSAYDEVLDAYSEVSSSRYFKPLQMKFNLPEPDEWREWLDKTYRWLIDEE